jgi:hypothetical protein
MNEKYQMNRQLLRWWQQEKGDVSLVYIAGVMMLMLLLAGLAIDGGNAYLQRRQMQTAADAAALAGGSAIAMGKTSTEIAEEINNMLVLNGADPGQSEWYKLDDTKGVNVTARQTFDTYFFRAFNSWSGSTIDKPDYSVMNVGASGKGKYKPVKTIEKLFPAAIEGCDCIGLKEQVTIKKENTNRLCVNNSIRYWNPRHEYAVWLYKLDSTETGNSDAAVWHFKIVNGPGTFVEHSDGTATVSFQVKNYKGQGWNINATLSGKTTVKGPGSPKFSAYTVDANEYMYYTNLSGTLTGIPGGRYDGAVLKITGHGPAFQMGVGASVMESQKMGGSSWFDWQVVRQPSSGNILRTPDIHGDINVSLNYCDEMVDNDEPTDASSCEFNWVDWDGDSATGGELTSAMSNLNKSGVWTIGDRVKVGPKVYNVQQVAEKLDNVIDKPMTILVYDDTDGNPEDGYAVCGFASFQLTSYELDQWPQLIRGEFTPTVVRAIASSDDALDFGTRDVNIIR